MFGWAAYLRVYEPLAAFAEPERAKWAAYVEQGEPPSRPMLMTREHEVALSAVMHVPPRMTFGPEADHAYVRHLDGLSYVCPWRLQQRAWQALEDFRERLPESLADAFLPGPVAEAASEQWEQWRAEHPEERIGIRSSTWQVPVPWFVLFEANERRLVLGAAEGSGGGVGLDRALVYLTQMSRARRRCARALQIVRRAIDDTVASLMIEELGRWLEGFHPHALVELDYGGLVHLLDDQALSEDRSVEDVSESLGLLAEGRLDAAGERYEALLSRWRAIAAYEHAS